MSASPKLKPADLAKLAWLNGHKGVAGLSRSIGRNRVTIYKAVKNPRRYGPAYKAIVEALPRRTARV